MDAAKGSIGRGVSSARKGRQPTLIPPGPCLQVKLNVESVHLDVVEFQGVAIITRLPAAEVGCPRQPRRQLYDSMGLPRR